MIPAGPSRADVEIEDQFLVLRAAKEAERVLTDEDVPVPKWGGVAVFPVAVFGRSMTWGAVQGGWRSYAFHVSHEPGGVFPVGATPVSYHGVIEDRKVRGVFHVVVGDHPAPEPSWKIEGLKRGDERPAWESFLPTNVHVRTLSSSRIKAELTRIVRRGGYAANRIFELSSHTVSYAAGRYKRVMWKNQQWADPDDILQACWERHVSRIDRFASPDRPMNTTWRHWLFTATVRDAQRELRKNPYGVSEVVSQIVSWMVEHPEFTEPEDIQREITRTFKLRRLRTEFPSHPEEELVAMIDPEDLDRDPLYSLNQVKKALEAIPLLVIGAHAGVATLDDEVADNRPVSPVTTPVLGRPEQETVEASAAAQLLDAVRAVLDDPDDADVFESGTSPAAVAAARRRLLSVVRRPGERIDAPAVIERLRDLLLDEDGSARDPDQVRMLLWEQQMSENGKMF